MTKTEHNLSRVLLILVAFIVIAAGTYAGSRPQKGKQTKPAETAPASYRPADPDLYAGSEVCGACHDPETKSFNHGPHWKTELDKKCGPQWQGCEACHGPGKAHVEGGGDVSKIIRFPQLSSTDASRRCLDCHEFGEEHSNFLRSEHLKNNVGCIDCHSVHAPKIERRLLKAPQTQLCYGCHLEVKPDFSRPFHHRVNEGLLVCRCLPAAFAQQTSSQAVRRINR